MYNDATDNSQKWKTMESFAPNAIMYHWHFLDFVRENLHKMGSKIIRAAAKLLSIIFYFKNLMYQVNDIFFLQHYDLL